MSKDKLKMKFPFEGKEDFDNESFYYFLPHFNPEKKKKIGEKITQFKGVIYYLNLIFLFFYIVNKFFTKGKHKYFSRQGH